MRVRLTQDLLMLVRRTLGLLMRVRLTQDLLMLVRRTLGLLMPAPRMRVRRPSSSRTTSIAPAGSARTGDRKSVVKGKERRHGGPSRNETTEHSGEVAR